MLLLGMGKNSPLRVLPNRMRQFVQRRFMVAVLWPLIFIVLHFGMASFLPVLDRVSYLESDPGQDFRQSLKWDGPDQLTLSGGNGLPQLRARIDAEKVRVFSKNGTLMYVVHDQQTGFSIVDGSGKKIGKIKLKGSKVNFYDSKDTRILQAKVKNGAWRVYDGSGKIIRYLDGSLGQVAVAVELLPVHFADKLVLREALVHGPLKDGPARSSSGAYR